MSLCGRRVENMKEENKAFIVNFMTAFILVQVVRYGVMKWKCVDILNPTSK